MGPEFNELQQCTFWGTEHLLKQYLQSCLQFTYLIISVQPVNIRVQLLCEHIL